MWSWLSVALSSFISISADESNNPRQAALFKTMSLLMLVVLLWSDGGAAPVIAGWITLGLLVSVAADSLYLLGRWPKWCFSAFIVAQLCYSTSFWLQLSGEMVWWLPAMLLAIGIVSFFLLLPKLDQLIFPVVVMGSVLLQLNWAAGEVWLSQHSLSSALGFVGTLVLTVSAALLALHDYRHPVKGGRYLISGSYILAHSLITAAMIL
ncbi:lysoplasmalogenase [Vibrio cholerae]